MKRYFTLIFLVFLIVNITSNIYAKNDNTDKTVAIYFYSPTCSSCAKLEPFLNELTKKYSYFQLNKYSIGDLKNKSLLDKYEEEYKVVKEDQGIIPVIFIGDKYLSGEDKIKELLEEEIIKKTAGTRRYTLDYENHDRDLQNFLQYSFIGVMLAGFINGLSPCSLSLILLFLSLLVVKEIKLMKVGIYFALGKFIGFLSLGTILFSILSRFSISGYSTIIKAIMTVISLIFIILNLNDFIAAKAVQYNKIKLQLPLALRKFNHSIIKKGSSLNSIKLIVGIAFLLGLVISAGEFLCTGQIYLATIVTVVQTSNNMDLRAFGFLIIYSLGFIMPILLLTYVTSKGKEIFELSELIRNKLPVIKLINVFVFIGFLFLIWFF